MHKTQILVIGETIDDTLFTMQHLRIIHHELLGCFIWAPHSIKSISWTNIKSVSVQKLPNQNKIWVSYKPIYYFIQTIYISSRSLVPILQVMVPELIRLHVVHYFYLQTPRPTHTSHNIIRSLQYIESNSSCILYPVYHGKHVTSSMVYRCPCNVMQCTNTSVCNE